LAGLGVVLRSRLEAPPGERLRHAGMAALVLALWVLAAWGLGTLAARHQRALAAPAASTDKWLAAICQPRACPSAARYADQVMPADAASIVLSRGPGATLVAWLDLDCAACRSDFAAEEPFFRRLQRERRNARLLMRAPACMRGDAAACQAPAAAVCAGRHAGGEAALDYLAWELSAEPGFYTLEDRRRALSAMSPLAVRCLDNELALGARGSLAAHEDAARTLADAAREHSGCSGPSPAWWCFAATPSFAIIDDAPPRLGRTPADAFASASGALRVEVLEQCLEAEP